MRLRRALLHSAPVARLHCRRPRRRDQRVPFARAPLRRPCRRRVGEGSALPKGRFKRGMENPGGSPEGSPAAGGETRMSESTVLGLRVMAGAAVMGILGDLLLRQGPWGVNIFLWLAALVAIITVLLRLQPAAASGVNRWMMLPVLAFGACFAWRASVPLKLMDALGVLVALALASPLPGRARIHLAGLLHYFVAAFTACLLTAAGPVFEHLVQGSLHVNFRRLLVDAFVIVFCGWIVAGYLRGMLIGNGLPQELAQTFRPLSLGVFEVGIVLGLVDCLFLAFVAVQVRYLFGGASIVGITPGLTYAEYARRGFIELVMVAALVLPLL